MTRPVIGPNGTGVIEHFLTLLAGAPGGSEAKMEAFGMLNGITAAFALQERADPGLQARNLAYLGHALTSGEHPRLAALLSPEAELPPPGELADRYPDLMARGPDRAAGAHSPANSRARPARTGNPAVAVLAETHHSPG